MKRVLFLAPYFLPRRRVGSMRPFRFVIHLREFGWEPTVLTIDAKGQELTEKESRLLHDVRIIRLKTVLDRTVKAESQLGLTATDHNRSGSDGLFSRLLDGVDRVFPVDSWLVLFWLKQRQIAAAVESVDPDLLWCTGDPWSGLVVGEQIARRSNLPWIADFRDPWTLCRVRTDGRPDWTLATDRRFERRVVSAADRVLFQAGRTEKKYRRHYPEIRDKTTTIYNSYDPVVFGDSLETAGAPTRAVSAGKELHIGFFGRFRTMSPASLITRVLDVARKRHGDRGRRIRVHPFGPLNRDDESLARRLDVFEQFVPERAVPLEEAIAVLRRFDILLLSTDDRRDEIIPAKLLEYLAAARPVLSMSANPEVAEILERTGAGVQLGPDATEEIADLLVACVNAKDEGGVMPIPFAPDSRAIERFDARRTTEELATLFDDVLRERGSPA